MAQEPNQQNGGIIAVARSMFLNSGYARTTIKSIAAAAGVTPTVVSNLYTNKEALFAAAMSFPSDPQKAIPALVAPGIQGMGERLVRTTLQLVADQQVREDLVKAANAGRSFSSGVDMFAVIKPLSDYFQSAVVDRALVLMGIPDARIRGALISSYLTGVIAYRYFLKIEPLASLSQDQVVALVSPVVQDLLDPTKPLPGAEK
jgi:AcrR family transcriptional regulator